jgi:hypothetical protein
MRLSKTIQILPKKTYEITKNMRLSFINDFTEPLFQGGLEGLL